YCHVGEPERALAAAEGMLATAERLGLPRLLGYAVLQRALALWARESFAGAEVAAREAIAALAALGDTRNGCAARICLASVLLETGALDAAEVEARAALARTATYPGMDAYALAILADVLLARGGAAEALAAAEQAEARLATARGTAELPELPVML